MDEIRIDRIVLDHCRVPARMHFSYGSKTTQDFGVVQVFAGGHVGFGECMGAPGDHVARLASAMMGRDARLLDGLVDDAGRGWDFALNHAREMLSMALHDLVARACGVPLHMLLGGARRRRIPLMPCVFPEDAEDAKRIAGGFLDQGFKQLKVKIFGELDGDCAIIRAIREVMPEGCLQADANLGYKGMKAGRRAMERLAEAGLTIAEDPFKGTFREYAAVTGEMRAPRHMLDAPTRGWDGIQQTCAHRAAHIINLHPNCQGTFSEIIARAGAATAAGIPVFVGGTGYLGIGTWAYAHVASVIGLDFAYGDICGVRDHGMPESSARKMLPVAGGEFHLDDRPGHGGELDLEVIDKYHVDQMVFE